MTNKTYTMELCSVNVDKLISLNLRKKKYEIWFVEERFTSKKHIRYYEGKINESRFVTVSLSSNIHDYESMNVDLDQIQEEMTKKYG